MADEAIIAVFKADIEQFKAQMVELGVKVGAVQTQVDSTSVSTEKFAGKTKSASTSIKTLSQGLGGVTGLLGITGRLFGVNTDKIQALVFASREFAKVGHDIAKAQKLATVATEAGTAATTKLTAAQRILNLVRTASLPVIGLLAVGATALVAGIVTLISSLKGESKAMEDTKLKVDEYAKAHKDAIKSISELNLETQLLKGNISQSGFEVNKVIADFQDARIELEKKHIQERKDLKFTDFKNEKEFQEGIGLLLDAQAIELEDLEKAKSISLKNIRLKTKKERAEEAKKAADEALKAQEADLQKQFDAFVKFHDKEDAEELKREKAKIAQHLENVRAEIKANAEFLKFEEDQLKKADEETKKEFEAFVKFHDEEDKKLLEKEKKRNQDRIDAAKQTIDTIFNAQQEAFDKKQALLDKEIDLQDKNIETQRALAERGLENTLAFEEKRSAELQRQQQLEAQKQKRIKLLETFLNSLAEYSKTNPDTALQKALLQVALAQAASAVFAEEGGIIGEIGERSNLRRKHKGGGDVLLHAQTGEGIFSRDEMSNLGRRNFHLLKDAARFPIRDDVFAMPKLAMAGGMAVSNADVVKELKVVQYILKNQRQEKTDITKYGDYIRTTIENGVTEVTKGKFKKPRF